MKRAFWGMLVVALAMLAFSACGGGGDDDAGGDDGASPELVENELAEAMLLTLSDLPEGFHEEPSEDDDEENPLDEECDDDVAEHRTGRASSSEFSRLAGASFSEDIGLFEDGDAVEAALDTLESRANCVVDTFNDGKLDADGATYSDASFEVVDFPDMGDNTISYRFQVHTSAGEGIDADVFLDSVYIRVGRVGIALQASDLFSPFDSATLQEVATLAVAKVQAEVDDGGPTAGAQATNTPAAGTGAATATQAGSSPAPSQSTGSSGPGASEDAVALGQTGTVLNRMQVRVLDVDFDAEDIVLAENSFNDPAEDGYRMVMISVEATNVGNKPLDVFFEPFYYMIGDLGIEYDELDPSCGVVPDELEGEVAPSGTVVGNVCIQADEDDENLVFIIEMTDDNFREVRGYFALQ